MVIAIDPGRRSGKTCVRGTRITVYDVLDYIASSMSQEEILADFPDLTETDIRACLAFTADGERSSRLSLREASLRRTNFSSIAGNYSPSAYDRR